MQPLHGHWDLLTKITMIKKKAYQKTQNFNTLQATLFNGKYLLEHAQMKHDIPFVTIKINVVECY